MDNYYFEIVDHEDVDVMHLFNFNKCGERYFEDEIDLSLDMTSLGTLILLEKSMNQLSPQYSNEDENDVSLQRLSLAHERLHNMPKILLEQLASTVKILDISNNEFDKLDFLETFPELTSLICDHNNITSECFLPYMPKLDLLWMNHCKILDLYRWTYKLSSTCPNLRYLSLMGNPGAPFYLNGGTVKEQLRYRLYILSLFPHLLHLDDQPVTDEERRRSRKLYQKHIVDILSNKVQQNLPECLRRMTHKMAHMISTENLSMSQEKNFIV